MRLFLCSILIFIQAGALMAQKCNCLQSMQALETKAEENLPSYYDQVILKKRQNEYARHKAQCNAIAATLSDTTECVYLTARYLSFFRDEHLSVNYKDDYFPFSWEGNDTAAMRTFFGKQKKYAIPDDTKASTKGLEGTWESKEGNYLIKIVKDKGRLWDYAGLVLKGDPKYWSRGQMKFALKEKGKNSFEVIYLFANRNPRHYTSTLSDSVLKIGRLTSFYRRMDGKLHNTRSSQAVGSKMEFRELSAQTSYLRLPAFDYEYFPAIDSIVKANLKTITLRQNLIIDIRNNGGGGDRSYQALLPFVLDKKTNPRANSLSFYAAEGVVAYYKKNLYKFCETKEDSLDDEETIRMLEKNKGGYTPLIYDTITTDTIYKYPLKVAILMNRWCASSAEGFVMNAKLGKRVRLYGENTWGMCSYGDWQPVAVPGLPIEVSMPTKRITSLRYPDIESIGVSPDVDLTAKDESEWLGQVQRDLEK